MSKAGCFTWAVKDSTRAAILAFCEGLLKLQALRVLSVSILRSNKEVAELASREAVVKP